MEKRDRRWLPVLLSAAVSAAVIGLMLGGWLFSLRSICALPVEDGALLLWTVLLSLAAAACSALPGIPRRIIALLLLLGAALALWRWEPLLPGLKELLLRVAAPLTTLLPSLPLPQPDEAADGLVPCLLFAAAVMALLLGRFTRLPCWWGAGAVCFLPLLPVVLTGTLPSWPGFLAMLAGCLTLLFTALYPPEDLPSLSWGRLTALAMAALLPLLLATILPQENYRFPQWAMDARMSLLDAAGQGLDTVLDWELPLRPSSHSGGSSASAAAGTVELIAAGPRHFTGRTMLQVEGDRAGRIYLRGSAWPVYTGTSWELLPEEAYRELEAAEAAQGLLYPQLSQGEVALLTVRHAADAGVLAYLPYQSTEEAVTELFTPLQDTGLLRREGQDRYTLSYRPNILPQVPAEPQTLEDDSYRSFVYHYYLDVPEETAQALAPLSARLPEMAVQTPEGLAEAFQAPVATALQAAQLLEMLAVYDLDVPTMAAGEDFVAHFLAEGRGYCVHFATAATLLLRMNGIPARYVSGYTADITPGEVTDVPDYAAHAWVEVYLDGYGWYPVEVTPGGGETGGAEALPPEEAVPGGDQTGTDSAPVQTGEAEPGPQEEGGAPSGGAAVSEEAGGTALRPWLALLCIPLLAALAWGAERLSRALRRREETRSDTNRSALAAYRRYRRLLALGAAEDPALEELGRKAKFSQHTLTEEERRLCWQRLTAAAGEAGPLPRWRRLALKLLSRY